MSSIGDFNPVSQAAYTQHHLGAASDLNEAKQMDYVLNILYQIASFENHWGVAGDISNLIKQFTTEMKQQPIPLKNMEEQMNNIIKEVNAGKFVNDFPSWSCAADQQRPGFSFMNCMLTFAQFLDGESNQNPIIHGSVHDIDTFLNAKPWNVTKLESTLNLFFSEFKKLNNSGDAFPYIPPPGNIFTQ